MADRVKGITIEIDGETKGLSQALSSVNKEIKTTQSELRDVNKLLKLDPGNSTLLKQKMEGLKNEIGETRDKLAQLKSVQDQMEAGLRDGTVSTAQYDAWQREIIETETELRSLEEELSNVPSSVDVAVSQAGSKMEAFGDKVQAVGDKIQDVGNNVASVGTTFTKYVTTPIAGGMTYAAKTAMDYESAFTGVMKTVDETAKTSYKDISDAIVELSTRTSSSAVDIAAVAEAAGQLGVGADDLMPFVETMIMLGDTTNLSAEDAATALAKYANITGLPLSETDKLGAAIVDLGNNFATTEADIVNMSTRLASAGTMSGFSETEILALSAAMSSVGIEAEAGGSAMSQTMTQLHSLAISYTSAKKSLDEAIETGASEAELEHFEGVMSDVQASFDLLGMDAEEFSKIWLDDPMSGLKMFLSGLDKAGDSGEDVAYILDSFEMSGIRQSNMLKALSLSFENMEDAVNVANTAFDENVALVNEAEKRYGTTESQVEQLRARFTALAVDFGEQILPILLEIVEELKPVIDEIKEYWDGLSPEEQKELIKNLMELAAVGPALIGVGKAILGLGMGISFIGKSISDIGKLVSWIGSLGIGAKIASIGTALTSTVTAATAIPGAIVGALAGGGIADLLDRYIIAPLADWAGSDFAQWYRDFKWFGDEGFFAIVFGDLESTWGGIKLWLEDSFNNLITIVTDVFAILKGLGIIIGYEIGKLFEGIKELVSTAWLAIQAVTETVWNGITSFLSNTWAAIQDTSRAVWEGITTALESAWTAITSVISDSAFWITDFLATTWDTITAGAQAAWDTVTGIFTSIKDTVIGAFEDIWNFVSGVWADIQSLFTEGFDIKLPHLSVTGEFSIDPPSVPSFDIDWYKDGGILTRPTLFGMSGGHLLGGGEAGAEAVLPLNALQGMIDDGLSRVGGDVHLTVQLGNEKLGSLVVSAQEMMNLRRGR